MVDINLKGFGPATWSESSQEKSSLENGTTSTLMAKLAVKQTAQVKPQRHQHRGSKDVKVRIPVKVGRAARDKSRQKSK